MFVSTKGRYSLRVMVDLAEHANGGYIPMKDVAARQEISLKYIEKIMPLLTAARLVEGVHGKGGGYRLTRAPEDYTVYEILAASEGDLAPVSCLARDAQPCARAAECRTLPVWQGFDRLVEDYFGKIRLGDLIRRDAGNEYII